MVRKSLRKSHGRVGAEGLWLSTTGLLLLFCIYKVLRTPLTDSPTLGTLTCATVNSGSGMEESETM